MKYLIIDTETTDLFDFSKPADGEGQPRLAQICMIEWDGESAPEVTTMLVKPDGWEMPEAAFAINGLTTEMLMDRGIPVLDVLNHYTARIDDGAVVVAFNAQYDTKVMRAELRRAGLPDRFEATPNICTMRAAQKIMGGKIPKMAAACAHFGIVNEKEHDAEGDAIAAFEILKSLIDAGAAPEPKVAYAKVQPARTEAPPADPDVPAQPVEPVQADNAA